MFSCTPYFQKSAPIVAIVSLVSASSHGRVTISALPSVKSVIASALASQQADEGLVGTERLEVETRDGLERRALLPSGLFLAAVAPMNVDGEHAVFVLHHPAHPHHRGDLVLGQADALALEIGGLTNPGIGADVDAGMAEDARDERRDADIVGHAGRDGAEIARERELRDVEFLEAKGAMEDLFRVERQVRGGAAFHLHPAVEDGTRAVVIAARDRDRDHHASLRNVG